MEKKGNPWIIVAVILGILCAGVISLYVLMMVQKSGEEVGSATDIESTEVSTGDPQVNSAMLSVTVPVEEVYEQIDLKDASFSYKKNSNKKNDKDDKDLEGMNGLRNEDNRNDRDNEEDEDGDSRDEDSEYILPESNRRELNKSDLNDLDNKQLTYARNEIYARHGRVFKASELNEYFGKKDWYEADSSFDDNEISDIERKNAEFIKKYQKENNLDYTPR